jgi:flavin-dependent dehydrogenase
VQDSCNVKQATISANGSAHELHVVREEQSETIRCRWIIDAAARSRFLKRRLDIDESSHHKICAAWFRLDLPFEVDDWSQCSAWKERCSRVPRRLSTNHLMGAGYWVWIIPLAGDKTSVGLVADPDIHPLSSFNSFDKFLGWTTTFQPRFSNRVAEAKDSLMDFKFLNNLSQDSRQVWSRDRWALTGESGVFADPFYSPGTDFIAIGNTFICDLIRRERSRSNINVQVAVYERLYRSFYESTMSLFEKQYAGFGDTRLMVIKLTWDYAYYWSVLAWLFFRELMTDIAFLKSAQPALLRAQALNATVQLEFRKRASEKRSDCGKGRYFDLLAIPVLLDLVTALTQPGSNLELSENCRRLESLAPLLLSLLAESEAGDIHDCSLLGDLRKRLS